MGELRVGAVRASMASACAHVLLRRPSMCAPTSAAARTSTRAQPRSHEHARRCARTQAPTQTHTRAHARRALDACARPGVARSRCAHRHAR
eukprot:811323-Pleurochrysis_carterae.AAC.1